MLARIATSANLLRNSLSFNGANSPPNGNTIQTQGSFDLRIKKIADQISEQIDDGEDQTRSIMEILRTNIRYFRDETLLGNLWGHLMIIVSVLSCFQYIYLTYTNLDNNRGSNLYQFFFLLELTIGSLFLADWTLALLSAENKVIYLKRWVQCVIFEVYLHFTHNCVRYRCQFFFQFSVLGGSDDSDSRLRNLQYPLPVFRERQQRSGCDILHALRFDDHANPAVAALLQEFPRDWRRGAAVSCRYESQNRSHDPIQ